MATLVSPLGTAPPPVSRALVPVPRRSRRARRGRVGWVFVLPFFVVFGVFTAIPAVLALAYSLTDITSADLRSPLAVDFVGFDTFAKVLTNAVFLRAMANTALFVVVGVPVTMVLALALALVLDNGIGRLKSVLRAAIYLPVIANVVAAAVIWQYAFTLGGPVNAKLADLGITGPNWLGEPRFAVVTVIGLTVWRNVGTCMVLFLAGLQAIPEEVQEAAALDGAGYFRRIIQMTIPLLRPTTLLVTVLMTVSYMNIFDEPYLVTKGGPLGATQSVALWVYQQFGYGNVAGSMAGSWILLALVAALSVAQFRLLRPKH